MKRKFTKHLTLLVLWVMIVAILNACGLPPSPPGQSAEPTAEVAPAQEPDAAEPEPEPEVEAGPDGGILVFGEVEPINWVELSFISGGQVQEVLVGEGEQVLTGQPLARVRTANFELAIQAAEASLFTAQARLSEVQAGPRDEEIAALEATLAAAQSGVNAASAQYGVVAAPPGADDIAVAQAVVAAAAAQEKASQDRYDYLILSSQLGTPEEQQRLQLHADEASLAAAQAQLDAVLAGASSSSVNAAGAAISQAQSLVEAVQAQVSLVLAGTRPETVEVVRSELGQAEISLAQAAAEAELALENALLVAPFDGVVVSVNIRPMQRVTEVDATAALVIADLTKFQIRATDLDELFVASVRIGQPATITFNALPGRTYTGQVAFVSLRSEPMVLSDGTVQESNYSVIVTLDSVDPDLRWGMTANVRIGG